MKTLGFIVYNEMLAAPLVIHARSSACWPKVPADGILLQDNTVTVFADRAAARAAIKRTKKYFRGFDERTDGQYTLRTLVAHTP